MLFPCTNGGRFFTFDYFRGTEKVSDTEVWEFFVTISEIFGKENVGEVLKQCKRFFEGRLICIDPCGCASVRLLAHDSKIVVEILHERCRNIFAEGLAKLYEK